MYACLSILSVSSMSVFDSAIYICKLQLQILRRYDVVLVQEIRDSSGVVIPGILEKLKSKLVPPFPPTSSSLGKGQSTWLGYGSTRDETVKH